jgi:hypothetical protein
MDLILALFEESRDKIIGKVIDIRSDFNCHDLNFIILSDWLFYTFYFCVI